MISRPIPCLLALCGALLLDRTGAAQVGLIETRDGVQLAGEISFGKDQVTVTQGGGTAQSISIADLRHATFNSDAGMSAASRNGLRGRYYSNIKHQGIPVERIDPTVSFDWGEMSPALGITQNGFSVRWEGEVEVPVDGEITFQVESDDGSRLWVDGKQLIDQWQAAQTATTHSGEITLQANRRYPIKLEYYDAWSTAVARLYWKAAGLPYELIPAKNLFPLPLNQQSRDAPPHGVKLKSGSTLTGHITYADSKRVLLETGDGKITIPTPAVGFLRFAPSWGTDLAAHFAERPPGCALLNRDYAEGKFREFTGSEATFESVLFGIKTVRKAELRAIKLADQKHKPAKFLIITTADTSMSINSITTQPGGKLKIHDSSGYHLIIPAAQIRQVRAARVPRK